MKPPSTALRRPSRPRTATTRPARVGPRPRPLRLRPGSTAATQAPSGSAALLAPSRLCSTPPPTIAPYGPLAHACAPYGSRLCHPSAARCAPSSLHSPTHHFFSLSSRSTRSCLLVSRGRRTRLVHTALRTRLCGRPFSLRRRSPDDRRPAFPDGPGGIAPPTVLCVLPFSARLVPSRPGRGPPLPRASSRCRNGSFDRWRTLCGRSSQQGPCCSIK